MNVLAINSKKQESEKLTKQERNKLHYQQKREELKAKRRQRYQTQKSEQKDTSTNKVNVEVKNSQTKWNQEKKQEFQREWVKAKRDEQEGVNDNALENEGLSVNIKDFEAAEKLISWLEKVKEGEDRFPRKWLRECLEEKTKVSERLLLNFWKAIVNTIVVIKNFAYPCQLPPLNNGRERKIKFPLRKLRQSKRSRLLNSSSMNLTIIAYDIMVKKLWIRP